MVDDQFYIEHHGVIQVKDLELSDVARICDT